MISTDLATAVASVVNRSNFRIDDSSWDKISHEFTEDEKSCLRLFCTGVSICPQAVFVDLDKVAIAKPGLDSKLIGALIVYSRK